MIYYSLHLIHVLPLYRFLLKLNETFFLAAVLSIRNFLYISFRFDVLSTFNEILKIKFMTQTIQTMSKQMDI